ncbi:hypothetical protein ACFP1I_12550 [Dyadobacter subterraneus]|uniref:Ribbon-helix-helix protein, CopG family n=1 Tax=Dyadobacter subterraneus TaxID=2773304 RepID=A0ABR9W996_9BACT|nr:hypothetical protein [Dyadobacter subterraneus]MBE9462060.1 hypothetical protein [Dyadobacter subterraneus]
MTADQPMTSNSILMEENAKKTQKIICFLSKVDSQLLEKEVQQSTARSRSEFIRNKLLDRAVTLKYRNVSLDDCTEQLAQLKEELKTACYSFEMAAQKLHQMPRSTDAAHWLISFELERRNLLKQAEKISTYLEKFSSYDWKNQ